MLLDASVQFVPLSAPLSLVAGVGVVIPSGVYDILGQGVGTAPQSIIGNRTVFGEDPGVGGPRPELQINIGTAVVAGTAGTLLKIALQAAIDLGSGGNYQPGTWTDVVSQDNIAPANLGANAVPFRCPWIPDMPPGLQPRYLRLLFSPMSATALPAGSFSAGTISFAGITTVRDDYAARYAARNFAVQ